MFVADIFDRVRAITYLPEDEDNFEFISDAVETLSNKGDFDALIGYVDIPIGPTGLIILPGDVEVPLRVNIDNNPTFARDKLYEFTLNGPGSNTERVGWQWEDGPLTPLQVEMGDPSNITLGSQEPDDGAMVTIYGHTSAYPVHETLELNNATPPVSQFVYKDITGIHKPDTLGSISISTSPDGTLMGLYSRFENEPLYRVIRVSKTSGTAHIMFRRNRFKVVSQEDFIPIRSKWGLLYMIKSLKALADERPDLAQQFETQALKLANEEQSSHNKHIELATQLESATVRNLSYNNSDSIIVADIYDDASHILGPIGIDAVFDSITEAIQLLGRKAQWDSMTGYVDIATDQYHYVTLPRYAEYPIKINVNGRPSDMKSKWYQFHLNGPSSDWLSFNTWEDAGRVVTIRDTLYPQTLRLETDLEADSNVPCRIFGYRQGKWIVTGDKEGFTPDGQTIVDRITRITKGKSLGYMRLVGTDIQDTTIELTLGYWMPDETEPNYRRIKLPQGCDQIRVMYRLRDRKVTSLTDPIHLRSKTSILLALQALVSLGKGDVQSAEALENKAHKLLMEEYLINNQSQVKSINFGTNFTPNNFIRC